MSHQRPSIYSALDYLRSEESCRTISIETGPSTSLSLYRPNLEINELLLSVFSGPAVAESVVGPEFLSPSDIRGMFRQTVPPYGVDEPSGPWTFQRFTRDAR